MRNVLELCDFGEEIVSGRLELDRFAAELYAVLGGKANPVYQDPAKFLSNTYPTSGMRYLLREALRRLSGRGGQPVIILDTEFGGGKSHALILLFHVFNNRELGSRYIRDIGLHEETGVLQVPHINVAAIDCRKITKKTLWGELATSLGKYELFENEDEEMQAISDIGKIYSLLEGPTLIIIDELPELLLKSSAVKVGDITLADLTLAFIMDLISAVTNTPNSMLVIALTGKQTLYERHVKEFKKRYEEVIVEKIYDKTKEAVSRQARFLVPVDKMEVPQIIRKRLIEKITNHMEVERLAKEYFNYFREKGLIVDPDYEKRIMECYPAHPLLIDILYDRVSTIEEFNRTRGVLRLVAMTLHNIYKRREKCTLLSPKDVDLEDPEIKDELTNRLKRENLRPVLETDCIEKAKKIDERRSVKIAQKIARTIFLYSLIGAEKISGIAPSEIKLAVCEPGFDTTLVDEVLAEFDKELWYLKEEAGTYYFTTEPNINKIINDYLKTVREVDAVNLIKETLTALRGSENVIVWEREKLSDSGDFTIFLPPLPEYPIKDPISMAEEFLERKPDGGVRTYRNSLVVLLPDLPSKEHVEDLLYHAKLVKAIEEARKDERFRLDRSKLEKINQRLNEAKGDLVTLCMQTYSKVAYPRLRDGQIKLSDLALIEGVDKEKGRSKTILDRVLSLLKREGKYIEDRLSPSAIVDILKDSSEGTMKLREIFELFRRDRRKPFLRDGSLITDAVRAGISEGLFGYADRLEKVDGKYRARINSEASVVSWDGWVVLAEKVVQTTQPPVISDPGVTIEPTEGQSTQIPEMEYHFRLSATSIDELRNHLNIVSIMQIGKDLRANLRFEVTNGSENLEVSGRFSRAGDVKDLLNFLSQRGYRLSRQALIEVESDEDLSEEFEKLGVSPG
ncbi:MAG: DUF499 domain-containing protein [Candidatus Caldarchaeum sp.]